MTQNFLLLVVVTLIGLGVVFARIIEAVRTIKKVNLVNRIRRLAKRKADSLNIECFRSECTQIGLVYDPADGYPIKVSKPLIVFAKKECLQYEVGKIMGTLMLHHNLNGDAGKVAVLLEAQSRLTEDQKNFWLGFYMTNPHLFHWHARLRRLYKWENNPT